MQLKKEKEERSKLELHTKKKNLIISGILEDEHEQEDRDALEKKISQFISEKFDIRDCHIDVCYRLGKPKKEESKDQKEGIKSKSRPLLVIFENMVKKKNAQRFSYICQGGLTQ